MSTNVLMGEGVCEQIEAQASVRGASKIMLVTDEGLVKAGIVDKVLAHIDKSKFEVTIFDQVREPKYLRNILLILRIYFSGPL